MKRRPIQQGARAGFAAREKKFDFRFLSSGGAG